MIQKIISGGQAGADRAALDWAMKRGIPVGGWCPKGRRAEDGIIPLRYPLQEITSANYLRRTELNVRESDATFLVTEGHKISRGSKRTLEFAEIHRRPCFHIRSYADIEVAGEGLRKFCFLHEVKILNVAGTRASLAPGIAGFVISVLDEAFKGGIASRSL